MGFTKDAFFVTPRNRRSSGFFWMRLMADSQILTLFLLICIWATAEGQINRLKVPRPRVSTSKFSLNPFKPIMNLMRHDPMKAAAQRHHVKYLPPPPGMYQPMPAPSRTSTVYGMHPYRPYPSHHARLLPPSTVSLVPPLSSAPSSLVLSALINDHHHHYRPLPSDLQIKAVRIPSKNRRPSSVESLNIADSVVRQLLDIPQQQQEHHNYPSVLVIEDPDVTSSSSPSEIFSDTLQQSAQKVLLSPPVHADYSQDSSADLSNNSAGNPEVFVIVSKNKSKGSYYTDDKKSDLLSTSGSSSKLKKYKITTAYDENGGRQVWIIKR
ncbi:uncharacterized protein LOC118195510 [Stegodyphus dumicola]|uniref:uncharacterized protein LOC118195510 n=1 Tax=Stegodyphus dumicola TaxID=202533 RepID=UPI0015ABC505|nr:uncharacterized protein LOC118195510 [Stegodyphus dumicola]